MAKVHSLPINIGITVGGRHHIILVYSTWGTALSSSSITSLATCKVSTRTSHILILLQKKTLVCHSLRRRHVLGQLEKEENQSSIQNVMWVQLSCVVKMKQRIITVLIVVGRGLSGHIMKEATSIILTHKIHGQANRRLQSYPQHKLEIRVAWLHEENTPVQQYTTISISIAWWITEASRSQSHH